MLFSMNTSSNVSILCLNICDNLAVGTIEANVLTSVANRAARFTCNLLKVNLIGVNVCLSKKNDHARLCSSLHSDFSIRIDAKASVKDRIRDLIAKLVGVTLAD